MQEFDEKKIKEEENGQGDTPTPNQENSDTMNNNGENDGFTDDYVPGGENGSNDAPSDPVQEDAMPNEQLDEPQPNTEDAEKNTEKMLTQSQVNELVGKARKEGRESAMKDLMVRYGVYNESELDDIFGRGQAYDDLDYDYKNQGQSYKDAMAENALLKSHIDENRWEDVKLILGGKGLEVNAENISALLPTHQEWLGASMNNPIDAAPELLTKDMAEQMVDNQYQNAQSQLGAKKPGVLKKLGNEPEPVKTEKSEEELAAELYGW